MSKRTWNDQPVATYRELCARTVGRNAKGDDMLPVLLRRFWEACDE